MQIPPEVKDQLSDTVIQYLENRINIQENIKAETRERKPIYVEVSKEPSKQQFNWKAAVNISKKGVLESFYNSDNVKYIKKLKSEKFQIKEAPESLRNYAQEIFTQGIRESDANLFHHKKMKVPIPLRRFISGNESGCLEFQDASLSLFMSSLFHFIQETSPSHIHLTSWDLYHGHLFLHAQIAEDPQPPVVSEAQKDASEVSAEAQQPPESVQAAENHAEIAEEAEKEESATVKLELELGILFHAKEYPKEFRFDKLSPIFPIGHPKMGGLFDVRFGTTQSTSDEDYRLRNYIYLLSTNEIYLLDPKEPDFPADYIVDQEFFTISESFFSSFRLGDVNYFPSLGKRQHPLNLMKEDLKTENEEFKKWYKDQRFDFITENPLLMEDLYPSPKFALTGQLRVKHAYDRLVNVIRKFDESELKELIDATNHQLNDEVEQDESNPLLALPRNHRGLIPKEDLSFISYLLNKRAAAMGNEANQHNIKQLKQLLSEGIEQSHAEDALEKTKDKQNSYSAYRAHNLLMVAFPQYRTDEMKEKYGEKEYGFQTAELYVSKLFYPDYSLEALQLHNLHPEKDFNEVVTFVVEKRQEEAEKEYLRQSEEYQKQILEEQAASSDAPTPAKL